MSRTILYFHVYIILDVPITYKCFSALSIRMRMSTYLLKVIKIPTQKGEYSCKFTELSLYRKDNNVVKSTRSLPFQIMLLLLFHNYLSRCSNQTGLFVGYVIYTFVVIYLQMECKITWFSDDFIIQSQRVVVLY